MNTVVLTVLINASPTRRILHCGILVLLVSFLSSCHSETYTECSNRTDSGAYQRAYSRDEFVILYDLVGEDALARQADQNANTIPDIVENIMLQLITMREVLTESGFTHPFNQFRYQRVDVQSIYVALRNLKGNGTAYDPAHRDVSSNDGSSCVLLMSLSSSWRPRNLTPAHELFHLYQYGYTVFKNDWYLEGMARWSESFLQARSFGGVDFPITAQARNELFTRSYDAAPFWAGIAELLGATQERPTPLPDELLERRYLDGELIIEPEATAHGARAIIAVLDRFDQLDREISEKRGISIKSWPKRQRDAPSNNEKMLDEILQLVASQSAHAERRDP